MITRRGMLTGLALGTLAIAGALPGFGTRQAAALDDATAKAHVEATVADVLDIVQGSGDAKAKAAKLKTVMETRSAMPQIARFAAGPAWREMSEAQQKSYTEAFSHFLATTYARRFQGYAGQTVSVGRIADEGKKGTLVSSTVTQPQGAPVKVDWLVSDRPGRVVIADIIIEGVSLLLTQRDEVNGMLKTRGGDVDKLIDALKGA